MGSHFPRRGQRTVTHAGSRANGGFGPRGHPRPTADPSPGKPRGARNLLRPISARSTDLEHRSTSRKARERWASVYAEHQARVGFLGVVWSVSSHDPGAPSPEGGLYRLRLRGVHRRAGGLLVPAQARRWRRHHPPGRLGTRVVHPSHLPPRHRSCAQRRRRALQALGA